MENRISVIVPVYNAEKTLERCVNSLTAQTYENIEIILVNDGSKDRSLEICYQHAKKDGRVRVIDKPNGGVSSARNAGLDAARGDYIMFCDSDDWAEPDWCECMHSCYAENDLIVCEINRTDVETEAHKALTEVAERAEYFHRPMLMCSPVNKFFSRDVIENNHIRFAEELNLGEDFIFCLSYLSAISGKVQYIYRKLYNYDTSSEGLSKKAPSIQQCDLFYHAVTAAMEKLGAEDPQSILVRNRFVLGHYESILISTSLRKDLVLSEKLKIAGSIRNMESFCQCSENGIGWGNPVYVWLYRKKYLRLVMLYLILRAYRDKYRGGMM